MAEKSVQLDQSDFVIDENGNLRLKNKTKAKQIFEMVRTVQSRETKDSDPHHPIVKVTM